MLDPADQPFPVPEQEAQRLGDLYSYGVLDAAPEGTYEDLVALASQACGTRMAAITFIDEARQWVKAEVGGGAQTSPRSESFCAHAITDPDEIYEVEDTTKHPAFQDNPYVTGEPHLRFYAGAPIKSHRGHGLGTVCVLDTEPDQLDDAERQSLSALSRVVALTLELHRLSRHLERANEDLEQVASAVSHDVGDLVSEITAALQAVQARAEGLDTESQERLTTASSAANSLDRVVDGLDRYAQLAGKQDPMETFALQGVLEDARDSLDAAFERSGARLQGHGLPVVTGDREQIVALVRNLLSNAIHHGGPEPTIHVTAHRQDDAWQVRVSDDGPGIEHDEQERLFELFEQGAGADHDGEGLGLAICQRIVERHGGEVSIESEPGEGTTVWFTLPGPEEPVPT